MNRHKQLSQIRLPHKSHTDSQMLYNVKLSHDFVFFPLIFIHFNIIIFWVLSFDLQWLIVWFLVLLWLWDFLIWLGKKQILFFIQQTFQSGVNTKQTGSANIIQSRTWSSAAVFFSSKQKWVVRYSKYCPCYSCDSAVVHKNQGGLNSCLRFGWIFSLSNDSLREKYDGSYK